MPTPEEIAAAEAAQEAAAEAAVGGEETDTKVEEGNEEEQPEKKVAVVDNKDTGLLAAIEKLNERLTPQMTEAQREEQIKVLETETGFNRKQLKFMAQQNEQTKLNASLEYLKGTGKLKVSSILGKLSDKLSSQVEAEMAKLDPRVQADPAAWENMAYLIKGKNAEAYSAEDDTETEEAPKKSIGGGMKGLTTVKKGGTADKGGSKKQYDSNETFVINQYFAGDAAAYEVSKSDKRVGQPRKGDDNKGTSAADRELARMTGGQVG